jgi:hypothetical protein
LEKGGTTRKDGEETGAPGRREHKATEEEKKERDTAADDDDDDDDTSERPAANERTGTASARAQS